METLTPTSPRSGSDAELQAATALARDTLSHFWEVFEKPEAGQSCFSLLVRISEGTVVENCWVSELKRQDGQITGQIISLPELLKNVLLGSRISVAETDITDWYYYNHDRKIVGNFTTRILARTMRPAEAAQTLGMYANFLPLKIRCACGQKFAFAVEPVGGRMPWPVKCPVCGADGTLAANSIIQQVLGTPAPQAPPPIPIVAAAPAMFQPALLVPPPRIGMAASPPRAAAPASAPIRGTVPRPAQRRSVSWGQTGGYTGGGLILIVILRVSVALLKNHQYELDREKQQQQEKQQAQQFEDRLQQRIQQNQQSAQDVVNQQQAYQASHPATPMGQASVTAPKFPIGARVQVLFSGRWLPATVVSSVGSSVTVRLSNGTVGAVPEAQVRAAN